MSKYTKLTNNDREFLKALTKETIANYKDKQALYELVFVVFEFMEQSYTEMAKEDMEKFRKNYLDHKKNDYEFQIEIDDNKNVQIVINTEEPALYVHSPLAEGETLEDRLFKLLYLDNKFKLIRDKIKIYMEYQYYRETKAHYEKQAEIDKMN